MKEFDWELAKAGRKVCTRDGRPAEVLPESAIGIDEYQYPIIAMVQCDEGVRPFAYRKDGRCYEDKEDGMDLMIDVVTITRYVNILGDKGCLSTGMSLYSNVEMAKKVGIKDRHYYTTAEVTWEEEV